MSAVRSLRHLRLLIYAAAIAAIVAAAALIASPAHAATTGSRWQAWETARSQQGCWYVYGSAGPCGSGYDCSGLVYHSYRSQGFAIPRTTYGMLGWWRLQRVSHANAKMGDLVFFGSGHVELYAGWNVTYGAQQSGTRVGYHRWYPGSWYVPTGYYHIAGSG